MAAQEAETLLEETIAILALLSDPKTCKEYCGYTVEEVIKERKELATTLISLADRLDRVSRDTGIARTTGGGAGVAGGILAVLGIAAAPFFAGTSLALTATGTGMAVAGAATTLTAASVKDGHVQEAARDVKCGKESLEPKEKKLCKLFAELSEKTEKLCELCKKKKVFDHIKDFGQRTFKAAYSVAYKGYTVYAGIKGSHFALSMAKFIQADLQIMRNVAMGTAAPGIALPKLLGGKTFLTAGTTTAKVFSSVMAAVGIGFGIWDIVEGVKDINGCEHAKAYRDTSHELQEGAKAMEETLVKLRRKVY